MTKIDNALVTELEAAAFSNTPITDANSDLVQCGVIIGQANRLAQGS